MSTTTVTGYASPAREPDEYELRSMEAILDSVMDFPFGFYDNMLNPGFEEMDTEGIYNACRFDILSLLAEILQYPVFQKLKLKGEFTITTYTDDEDGNTNEVSQVIEIIDSVAFPTLKINPNASSFTSHAPIYTQEEMTNALKAEATISYEMGYDEGFTEGEEAARMDMAYNNPFDEPF